METVRFVAADGTSIPLTDYANRSAGTVLLKSRRGWTVPQQQVFQERIPGTVGARYTGTAIRERIVSFAAELVTYGHEDAVTQEHALAAYLTQGGYLESIVQGSTIRRLDVVYRGGLDGDTSSRAGGNAGRPVLIPEFMAPATYWYDPTPQTTVLDLALAPNGVTWPITWPAFFAATGTAAGVNLTGGGVGGPLQMLVTGPFTRVELMRRDTGEVLDLASPVAAGQVARLETGVGQRRVYLDAAWGFTNITNGLSAQSTFWQLAGGTATPVAARVTGGNGLNQITFNWNRFYLAPG